MHLAMETFRIALKFMGKNSKNMSSKYVNRISQLSKSIMIQYGLYEGLHERKRTKAAALFSQLVRKIQK